ncbi:unnamed protein product [Candida verbasci]|uniref:RNA polymerase Rpb4/RPC9 core domain-containing protein n=1 Tax=Candida verbasci TaxID=1227364 RepID=A0A9W4TWY4_9ASCO|nr:unnamed protein product [Candida verbasci]
MNVSTSSLGVRRRKIATQNIDDEENAALLKLGPEFQIKQYNNYGEEIELTALGISEARLIIRGALKKRKLKQKPKKKQQQQQLQKSLDNTKNDLNNNDDIEMGDDNIEEDNDKKEIEQDEDDDVKEDEISNIELAGPNSNEIVHKTLNYLTNFARFKNKSSCETVEKLLKDFSEHCNEKLHPFELAQLGTLECEDSEEAKSLIPSLTNKVSDVQLQSLLTELRKYQTFQ